MDVARRRNLPLFLALVLLLSSCAAQRITLDGQDVRDEAARSIARTINILDLTAATAGRFLTTSQSIPAVALDLYVDDVGPAMQAALEQARDALKAYLTVKDETAFVQLQTAFTELTRAATQLTQLAIDMGWIN